MTIRRKIFLLSGILLLLFGVVVGVLAGLSELLAGRLEDAARIAPDPGDQAACQAAARWARDIHSLLTGNAP